MVTYPTDEAHSRSCPSFNEGPSDDIFVETEITFTFVAESSKSSVDFLIPLQKNFLAEVGNNILAWCLPKRFLSSVRVTRFRELAHNFGIFRVYYSSDDEISHAVHCTPSGVNTGCSIVTTKMMVTTDHESVDGAKSLVLRLLKEGLEDGTFFPPSDTNPVTATYLGPDPGPSEHSNAFSPLNQDAHGRRCSNFVEGETDTVESKVTYSFVAESNGSSESFLFPLSKQILDEVSEHVLECVWSERALLLEDEPQSYRSLENEYDAYRVYYASGEDVYNTAPCTPKQQNSKCAIVTSTITITSNRESVHEAKYKALSAIQRAVDQGTFLTPAVPDLVLTEYLGPDLLPPEPLPAILSTSDEATNSSSTHGSTILGAIMLGFVAVFAITYVLLFRRKRHDREDTSSVEADEATKDFEDAEMDWSFGVYLNQMKPSTSSEEEGTVASEDEVDVLETKTHWYSLSLT